MNAEQPPRNEDVFWTSDPLESGDVAAVMRRVLEDPAYLRSRDEYDDTPLKRAVQSNLADLVEFLLEHGADPNASVDDGYTCLLTAIESDNPESIRIVSKLIHGGADLHCIGIREQAPLHLAAARGHLEKARLLLDAGAQVDQRKESGAGETPLMEAAFFGQPEMIRLLLARGADPALREDFRGWTPLEIARHGLERRDPESPFYFNPFDAMPVPDLSAFFEAPCEGSSLPPETIEMLVRGVHEDRRKKMEERMSISGHQQVIEILAGLGGNS